MANWSTLKTAVADIINTNGNQAITGQLLQNVLNNIITNVGENATFAGIALLDTNPGAPDGPVFYLATTAGTYPNFNGIIVDDGEAVILQWNDGAWTKKASGFATQEKMSELESKEDGLTTNPRINQFIKELVLPEGRKNTDISRITISDCYLYSGKYYNTVRLFFTDSTHVDLYNVTFATLEEAQNDISNAKVVGQENRGYALIKSIGLNGQISDENIKVVKDTTLLTNPIIQAYLNSSKLETSYDLSLKEKFINAFNVNAYMKTSASYTIEEAAANVPSEFRFLGQVIAFRNNSSFRYYEYLGTSSSPSSEYWTDPTYWADVTRYAIEQNCSTNLRPLFLPNTFINANEENNIVYSLRKNDLFSNGKGHSAIFKVKQGDKLTFKNVIGGSGNARAYIKYDIYGTRFEMAEEGITLNGEMSIDYDGFIAINNFSLANDFECFGNVTIEDVTEKVHLSAILKRLNLTIPTKLTNNEKLNSLIKEMVLPEGMSVYDITEITISDCYYFEEENRYYNTVRLRLTGGSNYTIFSRTFATAEEALLETKNGIVLGNSDGAYVYFKSIGMNTQGLYKRDNGHFVFHREATIDYCPVIQSHLLSERLNKVEPIAEKALENSTTFIDEDAEKTSGLYYSLSIGSAPTIVENTSYSAFRIEGLVAGDAVRPNIRAGSSAYSYGKLKEGLVVETGKTGQRIDYEINCDGTFDCIIFNNYSGYVNKPTCKVLKSRGITQAVEELNSKIEELKNNGGKNSVKILCFGNSFTQDSMGYVPFILKNVAPNLNITLAIAYIGGCPLVQHCVNLTGESMMLGSSQYDLRDYSLQIYKEENGKWSNEGSMDADTVLAYDSWDIITFQQNGTASDADWATYYEPFIYKIHKAIAEKVSKPIKLGWLSVHGSYKSTFEDLYNKWEGTVENSQKIQNLTGNQIVFPFGTAVQNLRTTPLVNLGDGGFLMGDSAHLHDGIGCLAAAYANALKILEVSGYDIHSIIGEKTRPTKEWISEKGIPSPNYGAVTNDVVGITEDNCYTAQIAAIMAVKKPYEVTDCTAFYSAE